VRICASGFPFLLAWSRRTVKGLRDDFRGHAGAGIRNGQHQVLAGGDVVRVCIRDAQRAGRAAVADRK
jgi:hypothetical protein